MIDEMYEEPPIPNEVNEDSLQQIRNKIAERYEYEDQEFNNGYVQWLINGDQFIPTNSTVQSLPSGVYNIVYDHQLGKALPQKVKVNVDDLLILPDPILNKILYDIRTFWDSSKLYEKFNYVYKRGILLYGKPGCGKSSVIMLLENELISKQNGIVLNVKTSDDIFYFDRILRDIQEIEPDRRIICILEDIDNFINGDQHLLSKLLNILDGAGSFKNLVMLATTNHPEKLQERISNRPSRFDRRYEVGLPNAEVREYYIKHKFNEELTTEEIQTIIKKTEGFTLDHLKELLLSVHVLGYTYEESYTILQTMIKEKKLTNKSGEGKIGYGNN